MFQQVCDEMDKEEINHLMGILRAMSEYEKRALHTTANIEREVASLPEKQRTSLGGIQDRLEKRKDAIQDNQRFLRQIGQVAFMIFPELRDEAWGKDGTNEATMDEHAVKTAVTLTQFVRDWSKEGAPEREQCYGPMIRAIEDFFPDKADRSKRRILCPGAGLGRLPWELARRGFEANANEFTYFMLLAANMILHLPKHTDQKEGEWQQYEIFPFATHARNTLHNQDPIRGIMVPDVDTSEARVMMQAGDFLVEYNHEPESWDCIATCFFLDTACNILEYVRQIARLLKPGGLWVNLGPLLYHFSELNTFGNKKFMSLELTYEELKGTFSAFGLKLMTEQLGHQSVYNYNVESLSRQHFECVVFTCIKDASIQVPKELSAAPTPHYGGQNQRKEQEHEQGN